MTDQVTIEVYVATIEKILDNCPLESEEICDLLDTLKVKWE